MSTEAVIRIMDDLIKHCEDRAASAEVLRKAAGNQAVKSFQYGKAEAYRDMIVYLKGE